MIKPMYVKIILCSLMLLVWLLYENAQSQQSDNGQLENSDIGRENPFAKINRPKKFFVPKTDMVPQNATEYENIPELLVDTITLKFLDAKSLAAAIANMSSKYGNISPDGKGNSLIICDTKEYLERILAEIRKADKTPQQIMIEVVIVDVKLEDDSEIGVNWDILSSENYDLAFRQNLGFSSRLGSTNKTLDTLGNATAFVTTGTGSDFSIISGTIRNVVHMLQQKKDVEILASPRVMVVSGETAKIEAVEEIPYNEMVDTTEVGRLLLSATSFKDVGITLNVTAELTDQGYIYLTVNSEQKVTTGESSTGVPVVDARKASTSLLLEENQVVVLGGLRRKETKKQIKQMPFLGDIPVIGFLFKSTNKVVNNSELIVFLSPHIYKAGPIPEREMEKFKEIAERPMLSLPTDKKKNN